MTSTKQAVIHAALVFVFFGVYHMSWKTRRDGMRYRKPRLGWMFFFLAVLTVIGAVFFD